jgi:hypothetical protein
MPIVMSERRPAALRRGPATNPGHSSSPARIASGDNEERVDPGPRATGTNARQALRNQRAVKPVEAHDIGDRSQRDEIEQGAEIGLARSLNEPRSRSSARVASST